ncbi:MAG: hypothetical protein ACLFPL_03320 [Candidatus Nanoarchaeia archaeon]
MLKFHTSDFKATVFKFRFLFSLILILFVSTLFTVVIVGFIPFILILSYFCIEKFALEIKELEEYSVLDLIITSIFYSAIVIIVLSIFSQLLLLF